MAWLVVYPKCVGSLNVCFVLVIFVALVRHIGNMRNVVCNLRARKRERLMQFEINFVHNIKNNLNKRNIL